MATVDSPFPETRWSLIQKVRENKSEPEKSAAMNELCLLYWRPLYLYARRLDHSQQDAEDLTQSFFETVLNRDLFAGAERGRGRLRTFLLTAFQRFSISQWRHENRAKRGGFHHFTGLDHLENQLISAGPEDASATYDRAWAATLVEETETDLERDYSSRGRGELYRHLRPLLAWNSAPDGTADAIAKACGLSSGAVRVALKRLRESWRRTLEHHVARTVSSETELADEVRYIITAWAQH